ncbi:hypothetical protein H4R20_002913 [Coemansia guatemalensis]|uniref:SET domain-containing protein n=1 Tax=Coemansia guatemalensis TaxID=2761395 RepID=A0A9W8LU74_9FUNG|nr:hypothetical protein H4R20_002913 [Coemansia guatemalensis]
MDPESIDAVVEAHGLRTEEDAEKRRKTVSQRNISRGTEVLSTVPLYAFPLRANEGSNVQVETEEVLAETRCMYCFGQLPVRRPRCSQCRQAQYCSTKCLSQHWTQRHHSECGTLNYVAIDTAAGKLKPEYRPLLRMAAGLTQALVAGKQHRQIQAWARLVSHRDQHPAYVLRQYAEIASVLSTHAKAIGLPSIDKDATVTMLCRAGCNNFMAPVIEDNVLCTNGVVCSPLLSLLFNHSCRPNCVISYSDGRLSLRAIENIEAGQELTIAYADAMLPRTARRERLENVYFFACTCAKCGNTDCGRIDQLMDRESPQPPKQLSADLTQLPEIAPWVSCAIGLLLHCISGTVTSAQVEKECLCAISDLPSREMSFAAFGYWRERQDECRGSDDGNARLWACAASQYVLAFYALNYPPSHPMLGLQCLTTAALSWNALVACGPTEPQCKALALTRSRITSLAHAARSLLQVSSLHCSSVVSQVTLLLDQLDQESQS